MFLACMATSVFFSFDSLFSAIFPQASASRRRNPQRQSGRRRRIRYRRTDRQAPRRAGAGTVHAAGLGRLRGRTRQGGAARLRGTRQDPRADDARARSAEEPLAKLEEQKASAQSNQAGLVSRKQLLTDNVSRLESERPEAAAEGRRAEDRRHSAPRSGSTSQGAR